MSSSPIPSRAEALPDGDARSIRRALEALRRDHRELQRDNDEWAAKLAAQCRHLDDQASELEGTVLAATDTTTELLLPLADVSESLPLLPAPAGQPRETAATSPRRRGSSSGGLRGAWQRLKRTFSRSGRPAAPTADHQPRVATVAGAPRLEDESRRHHSVRSEIHETPRLPVARRPSGAGPIPDELAAQRRRAEHAERECGLLRVELEAAQQRLAEAAAYRDRFRALEAQLAWEIVADEGSAGAAND